MSPNVVGIKLGKTDPKKAILFGAHYDDRGAVMWWCDVVQLLTNICNSFFCD